MIMFSDVTATKRRPPKKFLTYFLPYRNLEDIDFLKKSPDNIEKHQDQETYFCFFPKFVLSNVGAS